MLHIAKGAKYATRQLKFRESLSKSPSLLYAKFGAFGFLCCGKLNDAIGIRYMEYIAFVVGPANPGFLCNRIAKAA